MPTLLQRLHEGKKVKVDGVDYWVVEGDSLLDEEQLTAYAQQREAAQQVLAAQQLTGLPLVGMTAPNADIGGVIQNNKIVRWAPGQILSYCVLRQTFEKGGEAGYKLLVDNMRRATAEWEATCGVRFAYQSEFDNHTLDHKPDVVFTVQEYNAKGQFYAVAFLPTDPPRRRWLLVDPSYYPPDMEYNKIGVLRHELGHVLGFRHEQIRPDAPPGCPDEDTYGIINLTDYDPRSVMHYFCGGLGSHDLAISAADRAGAQKIYGPPLSDFHFINWPE